MNGRWRANMAIGEKRFAITSNIALCCGCSFVFDDRVGRVRTRLS